MTPGRPLLVAMRSHPAPERVRVRIGGCEGEVVLDPAMPPGVIAFVAHDGVLVVRQIDFGAEPMAVTSEPCEP